MSTSRDSAPPPDRAERGRAQDLRVRPGVDVFSADQNEYIGHVIAAIGDAPSSGSTQAGRAARETDSAAARGGESQARYQQSAALVHEEDHTVSPSHYQGQRTLGEEMGPFPTIAMGNTGPGRQSAGQNYAIDQPEETAGSACFVVRPGRINPLARPLYIPVSAVHSISLERVVLGVQRNAIPAEWLRNPYR